MEFLIVKFRKWKVELFELMWNLESGKRNCFECEG